MQALSDLKRILEFMKVLQNLLSGKYLLSNQPQPLLCTMTLESVEDSVSSCCTADVRSECSEKLRIPDHSD